jgi:hypothetical protein
MRGRANKRRNKTGCSINRIEPGQARLSVHILVAYLCTAARNVMTLERVALCVPSGRQSYEMEAV